MDNKENTQKNQLKEFKRNNLGLLENLEYKFTPEGLIDWKSMVDPKFIYVNPSNKPKMEKKYNKPYDSIKPIEDKVDDIDLVIMLGGLKQILSYRGFSSVEYTIKASDENYASVNCLIKFIPNYETSMQKIDYSDNACATLSNTNGFGQKYLLEMATNRSLCRTIRSFCGLNIVSREELGGETNEEPKDNKSFIKQVNLLKDIMDKKKVMFDPHISSKLKEAGKWDDKYKNIEDLPPEIILEFIERIKKYNPAVTTS